MPFQKTRPREAAPPPQGSCPIREDSPRRGEMSAKPTERGAELAPPKAVTEGFASQSLRSSERK
jgi:hypothetical protein